MADYRIFPSALYQGEPIRIDLNLVPEVQAYMASDDEIAYLAHPDHITRLTESLYPSHVALGAFYEDIITE